MEALVISTGVVAVAEIGDKTQLLALVLAAQFRKPTAILLGILAATLANHALAAWFGILAAEWLAADILRWILGLSFLGMAVWILIPDRAENNSAWASRFGRFGPFVATLIAFFFLEMGDKTQVATVTLAARFNDLILVTAGTTLGMLLANAPAVLLGDIAADKIPLRLVHGIAAAGFAAMAVLVLVGATETFSQSLN